MRRCSYLGGRVMTIEQMRVSYTHDGDTIKVFRTIGHSAEEVRIRLAYIDAPEINHPASYPYAIAARAYLRRLLALREAINVTVLGHDGYGRIIGEVRRVRDDGNCALRLVVGGYAALWRCPQERGEYYAAQEIAQRKRAGIWKQDGPWQTPWRYR